MSTHSTEPPRDPDRKLRVAIVFGGRSSEHAVSCSSAAGILRALDRDRYDVLPIGIAPDGRWVIAPDEPDLLELSPGHRPGVSSDGPGVLVPLATTERSMQVIAPGKEPRSLGDVDVVFPVLHGPWGEDGTLQGMLDLADVRYVGSGVLASAAGMDKHYMKVIFAGHGLPVGPYAVITDRAWRSDPAAAMDAVHGLGFPVFVKPARAGSSMGITRVDDAAELEAAIVHAREHDPKVIVEAAIVGREIECAVLEGRGTEGPRTSAVGEIRVVSGHEFYDFEAKYLSDRDVELVCPADVPDDVAAEIQRLAAEAFSALGCEGLARVDCFYTDTGRVIINEINTMPGFTPHSMYPRMWAASGLDYEALVDELIELAMTRRTGLR
ncbi:MAG: D-alanine--D-alanine ligase [Dermatophilaceae bacterium]|jgi:D-alanine-D-alanine ligase|nr:D-alanine--D-alanine ligase [Actinomycetales bacterium]MBP8879823.1 D-alanine--D-alanine ligase [Dermatophilaceae bacterium]MBP9918139.1 D-alanine--D-alanine ligase [Dermatophilaceae bacterium]